jgi:hypothetical protein
MTTRSNRPNYRVLENEIEALYSEKYFAWALKLSTNLSYFSAGRNVIWIRRHSMSAETMRVLMLLNDI